MSDSILDSTKEKLLLIFFFYFFYNVIFFAINTAFFRLKHICDATQNLIHISDNKTEWSDVITARPDILPAVEEYIWLCTRLEFDPPQSSILMDAYTKQKDELEWRLSIE